jgi:hypothetical protein
MKPIHRILSKCRVSLQKNDRGKTLFISLLLIEIRRTVAERPSEFITKQGAASGAVFWILLIISITFMLWPWNCLFFSK